MPYTIKYIRVFESTPFKKIGSTRNKQSNNNNDDIDLPLLRSATDNFINNNITPLFDKVFKENIYIDITNSLMLWFEKDKTRNLRYIGNLYCRLIRVYENEYDDDIHFFGSVKLNILSDRVEVIIPCVVNKVGNKVIMLEKGNKFTPYNFYNTMYEKVLNKKDNEYRAVLKKFDIDLPFKVKFNIINLYELRMPYDLIFYNYQDTSYMDDFMNKFVNMFTNFKDAINTSNSLNVYFINCFSKSKDLNEVNALAKLNDTVLNTTMKTNVEMIYANINDNDTLDICCKYLNNISGRGIGVKTVQALLTSKSKQKPNIVSINTNLINAVQELRMKILSPITYEKNQSFLADNGFSNKLIKYIDTKICMPGKDTSIMYFESKYMQSYNDHDRSNDTFGKDVKLFKETPNNMFIDAISIHRNPNNVTYNILV